MGRNNRGIKNDVDSLVDDALDITGGLAKDEELDCGKPVNFTYYDHLVGIQNRASHPHNPEPDVTASFRSLVGKNHKSSANDIDLIERKLKKSKRDKPKSVDLYNQIGNFWRIKGDTHKSIECFRRALAVSPNNAEILLNLARVLFNLQYLDDAIFLTRRSLEVIKKSCEKKPSEFESLLDFKNLFSYTPELTKYINRLFSPLGSTT